MKSVTICKIASDAPLETITDTGYASEFDATLYKGLMTHDAYYKM